jgi:hypothetical protein
MMLTQEEALRILWANKDWENKKEDKFVYATTVKSIDIMDFATPQKPKVERTIPIGTTVLVTMYSRFGDVGIRDDRLVPPSNGYYARVLPEDLKDWREEP